MAASIAGLGAAGVGWPCAVALAQTAGSTPSTQPPAIGEIVVTARKIPERLQDAPLSMGVVTAAASAGKGLDTVQELVAGQPNLSFSGGIAGTIQGEVGIRGITTLVRNIGLESGVGVYVDGVYLGRPDSYNQDLVDMDRVEVLRGPQGSLFGKNTIAGVVDILTKQPGEQVEGELKAEAGNYDLGRLDGYLMGPIANGLSAKLAAGYASRDGTYRNLSGGPNGDSIGLGSLHGELVYAPTAQDKLTLSYDALRDRSHPAFYQVTDLIGATGAAVTEETTPHTIDNNRPDSLHRDNYGVSATYERTLDFGQLTAITAYRRTAYVAMLDDDQNQVDNISQDRFGDATNLFTEEVRFAGQAFGRLRYVAGAYYLDEAVSTHRALALGADLPGAPPGDPALTTQGAVATRNYALFADADYALTPQATLSLGLRSSLEQKQAQFQQLDPTGAWTGLGLPNLAYAGKTANNELSPTLSLSYRVSSDTTAYGRIAQGFKSAAFNVDLASSTAGLVAGPETAITYEVGVKNTLFDHRLLLDVDVFTTAYNNLQVSQLLGSGVVLDNAARATINGLELVLLAAPTAHIRLDGSLGYLNAHYDQYQNCGAPASEGGGFTDCSGKTLIGAPEFTGRLGAEYAYPVALGSLVARADLSHETPVYYEATNAPRLRSNEHSVADVRLGLRTARWDLFLWSKNVGDAVYITYRDDRTAAGAPQTTAYGDPRTYGVSLTVRY